MIDAGVLEFRSPGDARRFADFVRALRGASGVYVIRDLAGQILYVGESHTNNLYETLPRHFQAWSGRTAGPTYYRERVEVAVAVVAKGEALALQDALILALQPEDNRRVPPWQFFTDEGDQPAASREAGEDDGEGGTSAGLSDSDAVPF